MHTPEKGIRQRLGLRSGKKLLLPSPATMSQDEGVHNVFSTSPQHIPDVPEGEDETDFPASPVATTQHGLFPPTPPNPPPSPASPSQNHGMTSAPVSLVPMHRSAVYYRANVFFRRLLFVIMALLGAQSMWHHYAPKKIPMHSYDGAVGWLNEQNPVSLMVGTHEEGILNNQTTGPVRAACLCFTSWSAFYSGSHRQSRAKHISSTNIHNNTMKDALDGEYLFRYRESVSLHPVGSLCQVECPDFAAESHWVLWPPFGSSATRDANDEALCFLIHSTEFHPPVRMPWSRIRGAITRPSGVGLSSDFAWKAVPLLPSLWGGPLPEPRLWIS